MAGAPGIVAGVTLLDAADGKPVPFAFVAVTVNVYAVPFVRPATMIGLAAPADVMPPGLDVTVYPVIGLPPLSAGAVKLTVARALPATAEAAVGAPGTPTGVTLLDAADAALTPMAFVAVTVNV
jgi:hypothetical protein